MNQAPARAKVAPLFALGESLSFGLWDGRQVPCQVAANDRETGLPARLTVRETIPGTCRAGATIPLDREFWEGLAPTRGPGEDGLDAGG